MMEFKIYNYNNEETVVNLPCETVNEVEVLNVSIYSGDETVSVKVKDAGWIYADSSHNRIISFFDGCYTLTEEEDILKWFKNRKTATPKGESIAYSEMDKWIE